MASRFRLGHQEELGSGGKILHGRLHLQPFAPYSRPSTSAAPLALPAPKLEGRTNPSWFRGLISGAGKLISSVLGSEGSGSSPSECSSDCSSTDEEYDCYSNEHHDHLLFDGLTAKKRESAADGNVESLAIVSKSESKLVIEQLLMQETFTRAEYSKLLGILQSRVLDIPSAEGGEGTQNEVPKRVSDKRPRQPLNQNRNISTNSKFSPSNLSVFSPKYYASEAVTPDLRNKAVMEAKKWFEEKRLSASPVCNSECGPCILNTDMNQHYSDGDDGSPIEMAKAYMQSLPPWRSPSFSALGIKNPPSSGKLSYSVDTHLLQPSKVKKRDYVSITSRDSKENSRVSLKSIDNEQRGSKFRKAGSITRPLVLESSRASSATTNFGYRVEDEHLEMHYRKAVEVGHQMEMHKEISPGIIMDSREASKEAEGAPKDVDTTFVTGAQIASISAPQDSLVFVSTALENEDSFPQTETLQPDNVVPAESSVQKSYSEVKFQADNAIEVKPDSDFKHAHAFTEVDSCPYLEKSLAQLPVPLNTLSFLRKNAEQNRLSGPGIAMVRRRGDTFNFVLGEWDWDGYRQSLGKQSENNKESEPPDENPLIPEDAVRPTEKSYINGHFTEINNMNSDLKSMSNGCCDVAVGTREPPSDVSSDSPTAQLANNAGKPGNGTQIKSMAPMLIEPTESGRGKRRVKKAVRQKRWKG